MTACHIIYIVKPLLRVCKKLAWDLYIIDVVLKETQIYRDFIKANKIRVTKYGFHFNDKFIETQKSGNKWFAGEDDSSLTKVSAIYYYIKNRS